MITALFNCKCWCVKVIFIIKLEFVLAAWKDSEAAPSSHAKYGFFVFFWDYARPIYLGSGTTEVFVDSRWRSTTNITFHSRKFGHTRAHDSYHFCILSKWFVVDFGFAGNEFSSNAGSLFPMLFVLKVHCAYLFINDWKPIKPYRIKHIYMDGGDGGQWIWVPSMCVFRLNHNNNRSIC